MRPIDFCTPKPFQLEHSCSAVSQRSDFPCDALLSLHAAWGPLSSRSLAAPCSFTRPSLVALHPTRPKAREAGIGWLGAFRYETRPGRISLHGAIPTSATGRCSRGGVFFRRVKSNPDRLWHPCRLLRAVRLVSLFFESRRLLGGRQDRFRGGLVKGVRFADPGCLPPTDATRIPLAPKHERNRAAFNEDAALT